MTFHQVEKLLPAKIRISNFLHDCDIISRFLRIGIIVSERREESWNFLRIWSRYTISLYTLEAFDISRENINAIAGWLPSISRPIVLLFTAAGSSHSLYPTTIGVVTHAFHRRERRATEYRKMILKGSFVCALR